MKLRNFLTAAVTAATLSMSASMSAQAEPVYVAATAIVEHPALDAVRDGIKEVLAEKGYAEDDLKFTYESAQGNPAIAAQIARKIVGDAPDVIVAISTPSAQSAVSATQDIPVVFSAVTDPLDAKLVTNYEKPGANVTGLSDMSPVQQHLELIKEFIPGVKKVGVPYNPGEPNAVAIVRLLKIEADKMAIEIVEAPSPKSSDVMIASQKLIGKVDAIYCPTDNTILTALESVVKAGIDGSIPVFAAETNAVERGAVASLGFNYGDIGRQTGEVVVRILKGEKVGDIPVRVAHGSELYVNPKMAARMGVEIPAAVLERATKVVQ
ncbi:MULTISPECIES: ABC transporter substrate-binding protein [unclassified Neptuniibacter]|uniref:ABC transporter substrate-binding protein n=1 Tax=unclassified Neptuniibacter TaxID=2630693 RepID=UPI000C4DA5B9|nr:MULTISPECIES: ABC transporter substrate-binding protein [unclassified Neptuniibacter]MAY41215.1 ABC transporter permease [Oceanospirillaceae bacterium]|tara:strand:+ start:22300 stop:23268 length:969 start_codon:yes stop_codon:yes gene_type:complete